MGSLSKKAQHLRSLILAVINKSKLSQWQQADRVLQEIKEIVANAEDTQCYDLFEEKDDDGGTYLHFILRKYANFCECGRNLNSKGISDNIIQLLSIFLGIKNRETRKILLLQATSTGYRPLHEAIKQANPQYLELYLKVVWESCAEEIIDKNELAELFRFILHCALRHGKPEIFKVCLEALKHAGTNNFIYKTAYKESFITRDCKRSTPLNCALKQGGAGSLRAYLDALHEMYNDHRIEDAEYKGLLCADYKNPDHIPLIDALKNGNHISLEVFLNHINTVFNLGILNETGYKESLIGPSNVVTTPLYIVLEINCLASLKIYIKAVRTAYSRERISHEAYKTWLIGHGHLDPASVQSLCDVLERCKPGRRNIYIDLVQSAFKREIIKEGEYQAFKAGLGARGLYPDTSRKRSSSEGDHPREMSRVKKRKMSGPHAPSFAFHLSPSSHGCFFSRPANQMQDVVDCVLAQNAYKHTFYPNY